MKAHAAAPSIRSRRWALVTAASAMVALGLVLLFLLTQATGNRELYERNYTQLLILNAVTASLLLGVIAWVAVRLLVRLRRGKFGSRLLIKLAAIFALVGVVPGALIYVVSYQFVSRSIESWFDVKVEGALVAGLSLAQASLDTLSDDLAGKTRQAATQLAEAPETQQALALERLREQLGVSDALLWGPAGQLLAASGQSRFKLNPERPTAQQLRQVRQQRVLASIEGLEEAATNGSGNARIKVQVLVPVSGYELRPEGRVLQVTQTLPPTLVENALAVQDVNREYQERALARTGLRRMYIGTLTLSLFLGVFGAILLAVLLGNQLARPLLVLAEGVRQVAAGDLRPKAALQGHDELGGLTRSFAQMTQQLADAREAVGRSMEDVSAARAHLQTILDNLTAGVVVLDAEGRVQSANPGATRILRAPLAAWSGKPLSEVPGLQAFAAGVQHSFAAYLGERDAHGVDHWQDSFELETGASQAQGDSTTLVARGAELPDNLRLLVFDDISEIVSAQRTHAWGEVARRLAHEIKNPLTPIQLSAERLEMKLEDKLAPPEQAILRRLVRTIVDQVDAMKRLVNDFRDYARMPTAELRATDLNALVQEVMHLYSGHEGSGGGGYAVPITVLLDPDCPPIMADAQQLRQVLHNLLQNAQDATEARAQAQATTPPDAPAASAPEAVELSTTWRPQSRTVRLRVRDHGQGFPEHILKRAFEPYVTTKAKGTGLGLAVVKKIADEHGARVDISNVSEGSVVVGAQVSLSFPLGGDAAT